MQFPPAVRRNSFSVRVKNNVSQFRFDKSLAKNIPGYATPKKGIMTLNEHFRKASVAAANFLGSPWMFIANVLLILIWLAFGPVFHFSDTWQLLVNTVTTVITYLAVFLIQNTQNRDARAVHIKLDELISSIEGARNRLVDLEDLTDEELDLLQKQFKRLQKLSKNGGMGATRAMKGEPEGMAKGDE